MKAAIQTAFGAPEILHIRTVEQPVPADKQIRVRIAASSVTTADSMMRRGTPWVGRLFVGPLRPRFPIPGTGFSGVVESVGKHVSLYCVGDAVMGESVLGAGTNTEYVCVAEDSVVIRKPDTISHYEAAPVCDGAMTSLYMLRDLGNIKSDDKVLINGAAGSLGSAAVQIARQAGAQVTALCSKANFDFVRSLGAHYVIDYNDTDVSALPNRHDLIFDSVGKLSYSRCQRILNKSGHFVSPVLSLPLLFQVLCSKAGLNGSHSVRFSATGLLPVNQRRSLLQTLGIQLQNGTLKTVVDRIYPLSDIVKAHQHLDTGHKRANIVIDMSEP